MNKLTFEGFKDTLQLSMPPDGLSASLRSLWYAGKDEWQKAHDIAQGIQSAEGSWIHAYLHRKEGDDGNASYWYGRAGKKFPSTSLTVEWEEIVRELLNTTAF
jgi:hypothetical protein